MSSFQVNSVHIKNGVLMLDRHEPSAMTGEDVIELEMDAVTSGMHIRIPDGWEVAGISLLDQGYPISMDDIGEIMLMLSSDGTALLLHENVGVTEPTSRFRTSSGASVGVDGRRIQIFWSTAGGSRRWEVPDWSV